MSVTIPQVIAVLFEDVTDAGFVAHWKSGLMSGWLVFLLYVGYYLSANSC